MGVEKVLLCFNPKAGKGKILKYLDSIEKKVTDRGYELVKLQLSVDDDTKFLKENLDDSFKLILISGGDGTVSVMVNKILDFSIDIPIGVLPTGSANDFAYNNGLPNDIEKCTDIALDGVTESIDVLKINDRYAVNVFALGNMVTISQDTNPKYKKIFGNLAYYVKGAKALGKLRPLNVKITTEEKTFSEDIYFMVILNGTSTGGFRKLSVDSDNQDGICEIKLFKPMSLVKLASHALKVFRQKPYDSEYIINLKAKEIRIESDEDLPTDIDGENGATLPIDAKVLNRALKIVRK